MADFLASRTVGRAAFEREAGLLRQQRQSLDGHPPPKPQLASPLHGSTLPEVELARPLCHLRLMFDAFPTHFRHLMRILQRRGRTHEEAEDLIQETFLRVKKYVDAGGEIHQPQAFLVRTALNLSRDVRQHEHRHLYARKPLDEFLSLADASPQPDEVLESQQRLGRLDRALNRAGPRGREMFLMHRLQGMSYAQIADHFEISVSAVEKHIARAMTVLGEELLE